MDRDERDILEVVGANLAAERARRRLTQGDVASLAGMTTAQITRMERGVSDTGISKYVIAAWAMGLPPTDLLGGLERP